MRELLAHWCVRTGFGITIGFGIFSFPYELAAQVELEIPALQGADPIQIAVPEFVVDSTTPAKYRDMGLRMADIIASDLEFDGEFEIIPPMLYPTTFRAMPENSGEIDFSALEPNTSRKTDSWSREGFQYARVQDRSRVPVI